MTEIAVVPTCQAEFKVCKAPDRSPPPEFQHSVLLQTRCSFYHPTNMSNHCRQNWMHITARTSCQLWVEVWANPALL